MKAAVTPQVAPQSAREGRDDGVGCMACAMASCEDGGAECASSGSSPPIV